MPVTFDDLPDLDAALLTRLVPLNDGLRAVACTIAQLGVQFRRDFADRAARWIEILEPHPFYKLGQVMFDLLEWEDFMLDGDPALAAPDQVLAVANAILAKADLSIKAVHLPTDLPKLETGFYLYRDFILGLVWLSLEGSAQIVEPPKGGR